MGYRIRTAVQPVFRSRANSQISAQLGKYSSFSQHGSCKCHAVPEATEIKFIDGAADKFFEFAAAPGRQTKM